MIIKLFKGGDRQVNIFEQRVSYNVEQFLDLYWIPLEVF